MYTLESHFKTIQACAYLALIMLALLATVFSMAWYKILMQRFRVVYRGTSPKGLSIYQENKSDSWDIPRYYPTALRRVQITPKTSTIVLQRTGWTGFLATRERRIGLKLRKKKFGFSKTNFFSTFFLDRNFVIWTTERRFFPVVKSEINCASDGLVETTKTSLPCSLLTNQLAGFPPPIPFRFAYFRHAFPENKYPRNSPARTKQFGVLDNKSLIRRFVV